MTFGLLLQMQYNTPSIHSLTYSSQTSVWCISYTSKLLPSVIYTPKAHPDMVCVSWASCVCCSCLRILRAACSFIGSWWILLSSSYFHGWGAACWYIGWYVDCLPLQAFRCLTLPSPRWSAPVPESKYLTIEWTDAVIFMCFVSLCVCARLLARNYVRQTTDSVVESAGPSVKTSLISKNIMCHNVSFFLSASLFLCFFLSH